MRYFLNFYLFILVALDLHSYTWAFSSCGKPGLLSSCGVHASHCSGYLCCRAQAWGHMGSVVAALGLQSTGSIVVPYGLSGSVARGIFPDQYRTHISCIGRHILYYWATRETPWWGIFNVYMETERANEQDTRLPVTKDSVDIWCKNK